MDSLKRRHGSLELYDAGLPSFSRNFSRDSIISGILLGDSKMLKDQLIFCSKKQGTKKDSFNGEEFGKVHHEYPGYFMNGLSTCYNACDTTALFLIGHLYYFRRTNDALLKEGQKQNILNAVEYIKSHLRDYIFFEDPFLCGASRFALKVTYWKDSEIIKREGGMPMYPVAYYLAHVINIAGIRAASILLGSEELSKIANEMKKKMHCFFDKDRGLFYIAIDGRGPIDGVSSDVLHGLFYLNPSDLDEEEKKIILESAGELKTDIGYLNLSQKQKKEVKDNYHSSSVWPFEQAMINIGARKFGLTKVEKVSRKIMDVLDSDPEYFSFFNGSFQKSGCDPQLWTVAAKKYFSELGSRNNHFLVSLFEE